MNTINVKNKLVNALRMRLKRAMFMKAMSTEIGTQYKNNKNKIDQTNRALRKK
jgi:hypothetical protein